MKKKPSNQNQNRGSFQPQYFASNEVSNAALQYGSPQAHMNMSPHSSADEDTSMALQLQRQEIKKAKKEGLDHLYKQDYQPADFTKAVQYKNSRSYLKKSSSGHYVELDTFEDTEQLKQFGLGAYFYIQFFRRMTWLFFIATLVQGITIYINWLGSGMSDYSSSFSTYLIKSTLGNFSGNVLSNYDTYIVTIAPAVNYLALMLFYFIWKGHFFKTISEQEDNNNDVKPEKFCLEITGLDEHYLNENDLKVFFSSFGPVYEVSLVRRYKNKLSYFQDLDQLEEEIREQELEVVLGGGDKGHLNSLKKEKDQLSKYINTLQIYPKTISAFVHFQYEKSKVDCLTYFNNHYLFDSCSHNCMRDICCYCVEEPQEKYLFNDSKLFIKSDKVATPEDIQWGHFELSAGSKFCRGLFAMLIILIFLAISCTIIGLCSIYIGSHLGDCVGVTIPSTAALANATGNATIIKCYCDANIIQSFTDSSISAVCGSYQQTILISQGVQYAVIGTAAITNYIFGVIVDKLVSCVRPASKSSGLLTKTTIYTIFLIINSVFVPVLVYASIFGFTPSSYVSFLTIISSGVRDFFQVSSLSFYPTFTSTWYRNVASIFTNYIVLDIILTWVFLVVDKCLASFSGLQDDQGKILQKHMNEKITSYKLNIYKEAASMYLIIFIVGLFWAGVPVLVPLGFISVFSRYTVNRILLQGSSAKIQGLGEEFMSLSINLLPIMLIFFPIFAEWMLVANSSIYPNVLPMTLPILNGIFWQLDYELYLPFYIIMSLIVFVEFFFYNTLVRCTSWMCSLCYERKEVIRPQHTRPYGEYVKGMNILTSYNIKNNDEFRNVMLNVEKYLVDKEMD